MRALTERLAEGVKVLQRISQVREESHNSAFGENTERLLLAEHLRELEADIARDPGALAAFFENANG